MKNIDFTPIIEALIAFLSAVITLAILPKVKSYLAEKLSAEQRENLKQWVRVGVAAAEQMIKGSGKGKEKKEYVVSFLRSKGIVFDVDEVYALIESEVYKLTKDYKNVSPGGGTPLFDEPVLNDSSKPAEVLNEYCGDGNGPTEDAESSVLDEETEPDTADEECESDTAEADNLFSARNTCE